MEGIHGVDTSWLHHSSRGQRAPHTLHDHPLRPFTAPSHPLSPSSDIQATDATSEKPPSNGLNGMAASTEQTNGHAAEHGHEHNHHLHLGHPHLPTRKSSEKTATQYVAAQGRVGKEQSKTPPQSPGLSRKASWMSSLTSKFSGNPPQTGQNDATPTGRNQKESPSQNSTPPSATRSEAAALSASPKAGGSGFLSSALRRFSSSTGTSTAKTVVNGGICPRKVMNIDPHRERCQIPDLQPAKLRRVAFSVDVEIAAAPKYKESSEEDLATNGLIPPGPGNRKRSSSGSERDKKSKVKSKERSEGEALKHPSAMAQIKEKEKDKTAQTTAKLANLPETPRIDDDPPMTENPGKPASAIPQEVPSPTTVSAKNNAKVPENTSATPKSQLSKSPVHHDFGPHGMFEVDDWDDAQAQQSAPSERRGGTGGAVHHDFGRNGMFEIPSSSEDEGTKPKRAMPKSNGPVSGFASPKSIAKKIGKVPTGHIFSEKLMFEIPELQLAETRAKVAEEVQKLQDEESTDRIVANDQDSKPASTEKAADANSTEDAQAPAKETTRKKEKKKRSEEERKERKEKKRQAAIENGTIPVELTGNDSSAAQPSNKPNQKPQSRPTTDPLRIYRRCCQLRESTPLQLVVDQLSATNACDPSNPAVVISLDLSNNSIQLQDIVTLGDWLAVVPVRKLLLENCGLTDEAVRVILSGLLAAKTTDQAKHNKHLAKKPNKEKKERLGVISKLSLKNNKMIGKQGWLHIGLFLNMSRSLKAIDLSLIPFPRPPSTPAKSSSAGEDSSRSRASSLDAVPADPMDIFWKCMSQRVAGDELEEVVMGDCSLCPEHVEKLLDAVAACKVSRLGLAHNNLNTRAYQAIARYLNKKYCLGLDLGGNIFANNDDLQIILQAIDYPDNEMFALSLANCDLTPSDLKLIFPVLSRLPAFRFIDFSHNRKLFESSPSALGALSRWLPRLKWLKRLGLNDVSLQSEHAISLAEICPEIPALAHLSILENPALTELANAKDESSQEEACALYASLMAATRVSKTIVCIDIDVPSKDNSEVVKALAKQVVAYSLRNMERNEHYQAAANVIAEPHGGEEAVTVPDVLLHLVGHVDNLDDDDETPAPDQDYLVGGTGVVKALSVVLGQKGRESRRMSREVTPVTSGTNTPKLSADAKGKARDVSKNLLESARKIRHRLQPALVRAKADAPEEENSKRLGYLDTTLERMISRFESEYPECRQTRPEAESRASSATVTPGVVSSSFNNPFSESREEIHAAADLNDDEPLGSLARASRHGSDVSLASRQLVNEEGRLHKFGQRMRREVMPPTYTFDHHWGTTGNGEEASHIEQLRAQLENMSGEEMRAQVEQKGMEQVVQELKITAESLKDLQKKDPASWQKCKDAGMCTGMNSPSLGSANDSAIAIEDSKLDEGDNLDLRNALTTGH